MVDLSRLIKEVILRPMLRTGLLELAIRPLAMAPVVKSRLAELPR